MFHYIPIDEFTEPVVAQNPDVIRAELVESLEAALAAKNGGCVCSVCGQPIWAAGSALCGDLMCFTCITGEWDNSEDYEVY